MKILITGGTGFVGSQIVNRLIREGHIITVVTRSPKRYKEEAAKNQRFVSWDDDFVPLMEETDIVINLTGESLFGQRWTDEVKLKIYSSRIDNTTTLVRAIEKAGNRPRLMISVSGVDYYADGDSDVQDEAYPAGDDFLSRVCTDWENAALQARQSGVRVAVPRLGVVLGKGGGALQQMVPPFRFFVGGPIGSGEQFFSWIHMDDVCRGLLYPVENEEFEGVYNLSSPRPVTMNEFAASLGDVLNRPSFFRVPESVLKLVLGEAATPVLSSHRVQPKKLQRAGFEFEFEDLKEALSDLL